MASGKRVLIITQEFDPHSDAMVLALEKKGVKPIRFHTRDFPMKARTGIRIGNDGRSVRIEHDGEPIDADDVLSVWYRRPDKYALPDALSPEDKDFAYRECEQSINGLYRILGGFWINPPDNNRLASSKILQLHKASRLGLRVPETLVTNDPERLRAFYDAHGGNIVTKLQHQSFFSPDKKLGVYTSVVGPEQIAQAALIRNAPALFQENVAKKIELRITIIGRKIFAAAIHSQEREDGKIDWRKAPTRSLRYEPYRLHDSVAVRLLKLTRDFGLRYGAIDMIVTPDGRHVFLEINPNGQFGWVEQMTGMDLSGALADLLIAGNDDCADCDKKLAKLTPGYR